MSNAPSSPAIRFFQFESDALGASKSVNLFRGDVNLSLPLFTMPGRPGSTDMDASFSTMYESNLQDEVCEQNLTAPTGILGLGWNLPSDRIVRDSSQAFNLGSAQFSMEGSQATGRLILTHTEANRQYFELEQYSFWKIVYIPAEEQWEITTESGITLIYGGGVYENNAGSRESEGCSVAWGVRYGNWTGATALTPAVDENARPQQYAYAWYLRETRNPWGEAIAYEYNGFERAENGLIPGVEQFVGDASGRPFTRAVFLTSVTDVFGRRAQFHYGEKVYDNSAAGAPREYQAAHAHNADRDKPNAFQDHYETKFLQSIEILDASANLIHTITFNYDPLRNLTDFDQDMTQYGNTFKRYLKSIQLESPGAVALPGFEFDYYTDATAAGASLGALRSITTPEGARARYTYARQELSVCNRKLEIDTGSDSESPRVWFGSDFAVLARYDARFEQVTLSIYTWLGFWKAWSPEEPVIFKGSVESDSFDLVHSETSIGLSFRSGGKTRLFVYNRDPRESGAWLSYQDGVENHFAVTADEAIFFAGRDFILVVVHKMREETWSLSRMTWNWKSQKWVLEADVILGKHKLYLVNGTTWYMTAAFDVSEQTDTLALHYLNLDEEGQIGWHKGGTSSLPSLTKEAQYWASGASFAVLTQRKIGNTGYEKYKLLIPNWDENYQFVEPYSLEFEMDTDQDGHLPVSPAPHVIADSMIAAGETLLRYNGLTWLVNNTFKFRPYSNERYWFAHGTDFCLRTVNKGTTGVETSILVYDPNNPDTITDWSAEPFATEPQPSIGGTYAEEAGYPTTLGEDFFTAGNLIYYRGSSTSWELPSRDPVFSIETEFDSRNMINQGPAFMAYFNPNNRNPEEGQTIVLELRNGRVKGSGTALAGERYSTRGGQGQAASGPYSLLTVPAATPEGDIQRAERLFLYRYAGEGIEGSLVHYPVDQITLSNGFGEDSVTTYRFDAETAACDPSAKVVKYYRSEVFAGSAQADGARFGSSVNTFINGYGGAGLWFLNNQEMSSVPAYPTLDGMKLSEESLDYKGVSVQRLEYIYDVYTMRSTETEASVNVFGSYPRVRGTSTTRDGVTSISTTGYTPNDGLAPFSGLPLRSEVSNYNAKGEPETLVEETTYGYEKYTALAIAHVLDAVVQSRKWVVPHQGTPIPVSAEATTWKDWGQHRWAPFQSFQWSGGVEITFPFPEDASRPLGWALVFEVNRMGERGSVLEVLEASGRMNAVIYDASEQFVIAQFQNASTSGGEADFCGFADSEISDGWQRNEQAKIIKGDCLTGYRSLSLAKDGHLIKTFKPKRKQVYVLGYWYRTPAGYAGSGGWKAEVEGAQPIEKAFVDTAGVWTFDYLAVDTSKATDTEVSVKLTATNTAKTAVVIDNLRWLPDVSGFSAFTYDEGRALTTCQMTQGTGLERVFYDGFGRSVGSVGPFGENLNEIYLNYLARQGEDQSTSPNNLLQVEALQGGFNETFLDADSWKARWDADANTWSAGGGLLCASGAGQSARLRLREAVETDYFLVAGLCACDPEKPLNLTDQIILKAGEKNTFTWNPGEARWSFTVSGQTYEPFAVQTAPPREIAILVRPQTLLFYANGALLLSVTLDQTKTGQPELDFGSNLVALSYLAVAQQPKTSVIFRDALGQDRQQQRLTDGNAMVTQMVCDALGNQIAATRPAPAFFADQGRETPLMAYRPKFVDTVAFMTELDGSGLMRGEVNDYYNGEHGADDQGYPYIRRLMERSPFSRQIEAGNPGKALAIIDPWTSDPMARPTLKTLYGNNETTPVAGLDDLPAGQYFVTTSISQTGVQQYTVMDQVEQTVAQAMPRESGNALLYNRYQTDYDQNGRSETHFQPNYCDAKVAQSDCFKIEKRLDPRNRLLWATTPDNGLISVVSNAAGKVRFRQDAQGAQNGYYGYAKYDALDRIVERGSIFGKWDREALHAKADESDWPASDCAAQAKATYNGYLNGVNGIGLIREVKSFADDDENGMTVHETCEYDTFSRPALVRCEMEGTDCDHELVFAYERGGKLKRVTYPEAAGLDPVHYRYDALNRLTGVGTSDNPQRYGAYRYMDNGAIESQALNGREILNTIHYHPSGRPESFVSANPNLGFSETVPNYFPDGRIENFNYRMKGADFESELKGSAAYNPTGSLLRTIYEAQTDWNLDVSAYDANGNMRQLKAGPRAQSYDYEAGTNRVLSVKTEGVRNLDYKYNAKGGVSHMSGLDGQDLALEYLRNGFLTSRIRSAQDGMQLDFCYGAAGRRVYKRYSRAGEVIGFKYYLRGMKGLPLFEKTEAGTTAYIYGPRGMIAFKQDDALHFVVKDHLGSNRMVFSEDHRVEACWSYSTFGLEQTVSGGVSLDYRFAGMEWDRETGLYNFNARLYDPRLRRFLFTDPAFQYAGAYIFNGNDPLNRIDPTGMFDGWSIFHFVVSLAEIAVGVAADVASFGILADTVGGAFIGAGLGSGADIIVSWANGEDYGWREFGISQATGAVTGALTAGIGSFSRIPAMKLEAKGGSGWKAVSKVTQGVASIIGGTGASVVGKMVSNSMDGRHDFDDDLGRTALLGALSGTLGTATGAVAGMDVFSKKVATKFGASAGAGMVNALAAEGITALIEQRDFEVWDVVITASLEGSVGAFGPLKKDTKPKWFGKEALNEAG
jgi:RHS repeat-associated protein